MTEMTNGWQRRELTSSSITSYFFAEPQAVYTISSPLTVLWWPIDPQALQTHFNQHGFVHEDFCYRDLPYPDVPHPSASFRLIARFVSEHSEMIAVPSGAYVWKRL